MPPVELELEPPLDEELDEVEELDEEDELELDEPLVLDEVEVPPPKLDEVDEEAPLEVAPLEVELVEVEVPFELELDEPWLDEP